MSKVGFGFQYLNNSFKNSVIGFKRYSGEYNIMALVVGILYFDHYLENKIRRDLQKMIRVQASFEQLEDELKEMKKIGEM